MTSGADVTDQPAITLRVNTVIRHPADLREGMFISVDGNILYVTDAWRDNPVEPHPSWTVNAFDGTGYMQIKFCIEDEFGLAVKQIVPVR